MIAGLLACYETFAERYKSCNIVIPAEAGIQCFKGLSGFRIKSGMTEKGLIQRSRYLLRNRVWQLQVSALLVNWVATGAGLLVLLIAMPKNFLKTIR